MKDDVAIFTTYEEKGDDFIVRAAVIKNGNSFESHAYGEGVEETEDRAIRRAKLLAGIK